MLLSSVFYIALFLISGCSPAPKPQKALPDFSLTAVTVDGTSPFDVNRSHAVDIAGVMIRALEWEEGR